MRLTIPDLSEPLLSPRCVRRLLFWLCCFVLFVAFMVWWKDHGITAEFLND